MNRERRVQKYSNLRDEIDNMDEAMLKKIQTQKHSIVRESMRHSNVKSLTQTNTNLSIDEILKGHSDYLKVDEYQGYQQKNFKKTKICVLALAIIALIVVGIIVAWTLL